MGVADGQPLHQRFELSRGDLLVGIAHRRLWLAVAFHHQAVHAQVHGFLSHAFKEFPLAGNVAGSHMMFKSGMAICRAMAISHIGALRYSC